ncbi:MAG: glycosyltransferase family 39 protein [Verrucomicrobiota bacterium]
MTHQSSPLHADTHFKGWSYGSLAAILVIAVTLFRFWFCTRLELVGDEAYYWYCSRHLDLSFFDKGPGAAATIAVGTWLFGNTVFGVRFFAVMLSMATGLALFAFAKMLFTPKIGFRALVLALLIPLFAVGSILMTIDPLSVFFWTVAAILFWKAVNHDSIPAWIGTGAMIGIGMLAKYTNLAEIICFALFCAWTPGHRKHLRRPGFYLMILCALAFSLPVFIWNSRHDWITVEHLLHRGAMNSAWRFRPQELLAFLGQQAGVISPLIFLGILLAVFWPKLSKPAPVESRYLQSLFLPLFIFYCYLSINKAGQANWTAPSYVAGIVLIAAKWDEIKERLPWTRNLAWVALGIAALETIVMHNTFWLHLPPNRDPLNRARGFQTVAQRASELAKEQGTTFFVTNKYMNSGLLSFYLPGHPDTYMPTSPHIENQFSIWPGYLKIEKPGASGLFVSDSKDVPNSFRKDFGEVKPLGEFDATYRDRFVKKYYFFLCRDLHSAASHP